MISIWLFLFIVKRIRGLLTHLFFCYYQGNVGDSRAIASVGGRVEELSNDHKPSLASEQRRITAAGGWVELNRVNGNLALSRALGDFVFKKNEEKGPEDQIVTGKMNSNSAV